MRHSSSNRWRAPPSLSKQNKPKKGGHGHYFPTTSAICSRKVLPFVARLLTATTAWWFQQEAQHPRVTFPSLLERIQILPQSQGVQLFPTVAVVIDITLGYCLNSNSRLTCYKKEKKGAQFDSSDRHSHRKGRTDFCSLNSFCIFQEINIPWLCMWEILINPPSSPSLLSLMPAFKSLAEVVSITGHSALDKGCPLCTSIYTSGDCKAKEAEASILNLLQNDC